MIAFYHQTKTPIGFWCRRGLNTRSLIQPSETLPVELTIKSLIQPIASAPCKSKVINLIYINFNFSKMLKYIK